MILSVVIIARNAETSIEDCLKSVTFADEIIIVDGGSIDRTNEIAKKYKAKIIKGADWNFAEQRNIGMKAAQGEWLFYIDTDERVSEELQKDIQKVIDYSSSEARSSHFIRTITPTAFRIKRQNYYLGNHRWPKIEKLERLFKKEFLEGWYGKLHETPKYKGEIGELDGFLLHYTHQDLSGMVEKTIAWSKIEAKLRLDANHPKMSTWRFVRVMVTGFIYSYIQQGGWKVGVTGLVESMYQSYSMFITYARLWEFQMEKVKDSKG